MQLQVHKWKRSFQPFPVWLVVVKKKKTRISSLRIESDREIGSNHCRDHGKKSIIAKKKFLPVEQKPDAFLSLKMCFFYFLVTFFQTLGCGSILVRVVGTGI